MSLLLIRDLVNISYNDRNSEELLMKKDKEERHLLFFNEFTVKVSREVVAGGKMKCFLFCF